MQHNTPSEHTGEQEPRWPRTPQTQHSKPRGHTGEQEPSGPGHCTHVGRPRDRKEPIPHGSDALGRPSRPTGPVAGAVLQGHWSIRARPGCIGDHGKRHPEPWKQPVTGEPVHSPGGGHLPSRVAPQLKPQG